MEWLPEELLVRVLDGRWRDSGAVRAARVYRRWRAIYDTIRKNTTRRGALRLCGRLTRLYLMRV